MTRFSKWIIFEVINFRKWPILKKTNFLNDQFWTDRKFEVTFILQSDRKKNFIRYNFPEDQIRLLNVSKLINFQEA